MGELYDEYLKKRKKNKKRIADEWNEENPDQKISKDDLAPVRTTVKNDDLAPVKTTSGKWYEDWLDKPKAFSDGLDLFDIHKTILGSGKDLEQNIAKGILKAGEGILDAGTFAAGKISEAFGNEKFAEKAYSFQQRDLVEETKLAERVLDKMNLSNPAMNLFNPAMKVFEFGNTNNSVFAEKSDSLVQSAGQLGAAMGLQSVGVPWWATMGTSAFGQSSGEAMKQGATSNEALVYGGISAGAEVLSEKLFGGIKFGGKTLDEGAKKLLANAISNKTASTLVRFGFDAAGEGFEEVVTDVATRVGERLTFGDDKTLDELLTSEEAMNSYIESFIGGAVMGGGFNVGRLGKSLKTGRDYDTGFSSNEQSIIDKEIKKRSGELQKEAAASEEVEKRISGMDKGANITDAEKRSIRKAVMEEMENGTFDYSQTKLSKKEAAEIEKQVVEDFKKGFFDIDTIEGTLMEAETAKIRELKEQQNKTTNEAKKTEIQREIDRLSLEKNKKMKDLVHDDYWLQESYRQELLKGKEFAREAKDTDSEITKELAESAKAAGMNNTRKMHELFDYTNKIANDTDTKYGFTNSKQLKDMGYSKEGATINGMVRVQEDGSEKVLINVDSGKALNTIIGHETTHLLEGTQEHKDLVAAVKEYAEMKGEYDGRFKAVTELYQNVDANIENEVTADLVGDYIFTDEQFVMELTKKPNVFQKVYDYIKHAYKMATAGSSEARQLMKAKRAFEKAYKNMKPSTENNSVRYELEKYSDHQLKNWENSKKIVVYKDEQHLVDFVNESKQENAFKKMYFGTIPESLAERVLNDTGIDVRGRNVALASYEVKKIFKSHGNEAKEQSRGQRAVEVEDFVYIKEVIESPDDIKLSDETYEGHPVIIFTKSIGGDVAVVTYDVDPQNDLRVQTIYMNKNVTKKRSLATVIDGEPPNITSETASGTASKNIISRNAAKNNGKFSISDNQGRELSAEQQDFFKDSKVRDVEGNLLRLYHQTENEFTVFDTKHEGAGSRDGGTPYGVFLKPAPNDIGLRGKKQMPLYANIKNPLVVRDRYELDRVLRENAEYDAVRSEHENLDVVYQKKFDDAKNALRDYLIDYRKNNPNASRNDIYNDPGFDEVFSAEDRIVEEWTSKADELSIKCKELITAYLNEQGYDGIILEEDAGSFGRKTMAYIALRPEQVKNIDNESPTENPDIRYSLSENDDIAPVGGYAVYGDDVKLKDDLAPVRNIDNDVEDIDPSMFEPWPDEPAAEPVVDYQGTTVPMDTDSMRLLTKNMKEVLGLNQTQRNILKGIIQDYSTGKIATGNDLYNAIADQFGVQTYEVRNEELMEVKKALRETPIRVPDTVKDGMKGYFEFRQRNFGKLKIGNKGLEIEDAYMALNEINPGHFPADIINPEDQLYHMAEVANLESSVKEEYILPEEKIAEATDFIRESVSDYKRTQKLKAALRGTPSEKPLSRKELRRSLIVNEEEFLRNAMNNAKNIPVALMSNTNTVRVTEMVFGRRAGKKINEMIFQRALDNEARSIAWQNKERADIKKLGIKPGSKMSAAVQKYGEKQYVNEYGDLVPYTEEDLEREFPDKKDQAKIVSAAYAMRQKYDEYIDAVNVIMEERGFAPIPKLDNYMRHFQALNDVFSKVGIPLNPEEIKQHDLPTDINGLTSSFKPQRHFFASILPRKGLSTTLDAVRGIDGYIGGVANLLFHTEDIQRGRAFEDMIRETYGQIQDDDKLNQLSEEERAELEEKIQGNHLSGYAAWLREWTNNLAGKKDVTDRGPEIRLGRKAFTVLDTLKTGFAVSSLGLNVGSAMTNFIAPVQAAAKTNKVALAKGTADTVRNIFQKDDFIEKNPFLTSRMGTDPIYKTPWRKGVDMTFMFMRGSDWFTSNQIVRSKYHELIAKGRTEEQAHAEAGQFAARIMGDRTKGATPGLYNSKIWAPIFQFQLEVNNQLYSMFYDTYHESKEAAEGHALKATAGMLFTLGQLVTYTHVFGETYKAIVGRNPTFDLWEIVETLFGGDDEEEKTFADRAKEAADMLVDALPYVNVLTGGGRIPMTAAIPDIVGWATGEEDEYGNKVKLGKELAKLPLAVVPAYGQIRKTYQGLKMFDDDLPIAGSYTDSGNLRFPVAPTPKNIAQAAVFGQWASENAQAYFDGEHTPLKEKQLQEFVDLDLPIADYWKIKSDMAKIEKTEKQSVNDQKIAYIDDLDLPISKKNILANNVLDDRKEKVDMATYDNFWTLEEFDFAVKNPGKYTVAKAIGGYEKYNAYMDEINKFRADKDENGNSISGSAKEKVIEYLAGTDLEYGEQALLLKCKGYKLEHDMNYALIEYLGGRADISYEDTVSILTELGYKVDDYGNVRW